MGKRHLYPVYETDAWLSRNQMECRGIYTSKEEAIEAISEHHEIPLEEFDGLTKEEAINKIRHELETIGQTFGYTVNYVILACSQNEWA